MAEDADDMRKLVVLYLKKLGLTALEACNGQEAVELTMREQPDAVLMDMEMPLLHGLDAVRQLRAAGYRRSILALTSHVDQDALKRALLAGCNETLRKPLTLAQLKSALAEALGSDPAVGQPEPACGNSRSAAEVVCVSKVLQGLLPVFLSTRQEDIAKIEAGLADRNFDLLARTGHTLKGTAGAYGFDAICRMGDMIERAALAHDEAVIRTQLAAFRHHLANLKVQLV